MRPRLPAWLLLGTCGVGLFAPARPPSNATRGPLVRAYLGRDEIKAPKPIAEETMIHPRNTPPPERPTPLPEPQSLEGLEIEIQNGSGAPKVALKLSVALDRRRVRTLRVYNAERWNYPTTMIRSREEFQGRARMLAELLGLGPESLNLAGPIAEDADLVIILGQDHDRVVRKASRRDEP